MQNYQLGCSLMALRTKKRNLRRQLLRARIVAQYNQQQDTLLSYELFCKYSMNDEWALWLGEHTIPYHHVPDVIPAGDQQ